jgi:predicted house-cleaning NTP pyrophosphatase (Maf/HAM1 superfamily)
MSNIIGLPLEETATLLASAGVEVAPFAHEI